MRWLLKQAEPEERLGELADIREVVSALVDAFGYSEEQVDEATRSKRAKRGGFNRRIWLYEVAQTI